MDCIVLAGNRKNYRVVSNENNKAFLKIGSKSILQIMLEELVKVAAVERILLVGPQERLTEHLQSWVASHPEKPVLIFEQKNDLVENILAVFDATMDGAGPDRYVLILPSDIPLLIAEELEEFLGMCDMERYDYVGGVTSEHTLARFYPAGGRPGVKLSYFYSGGEGFRINNLHMVRPYAVGNMDNIRRTYASRYQKEWGNLIRIVLRLLRHFFQAPGAVFLFLGVHAISWLKILGLRGPAMKISRYFSLERLEGHISKVLATRMHIVVNSFGGSTVDVDNEPDYLNISERFQDFIQLQRNCRQGN